MFLDNFFIRFRDNRFELNAFYLGIFLLPALPSVALVFLLVPFISLSLKSKSYFKDAYNFPFILSALLIILSCINNTFFPNGIYEDLYDISQIWIGIFNWIPYFWVFWLFQDFSLNNNLRKNIIIILILGTIPVIISGLMQYFFKFHGPFVIFNGFITWYSREIEPGDGMTGLFNNANYLGMWLNIIWPFSLIFLKENFFKPKGRLIALIFLVSTLICTILTFSRNAWLGLVLSTLLVLGLRCLKWLIPLLILCITPVLIGLGFSPNNFLVEFTQKFVPEIIFHQFNNLGFENFAYFIRVQIWNSALNFISQKPLTGWGSSSFPVLFKINTGGDFFAHSHNLPLEIALNFGIPTAFLITSTIIYILYSSKRIIFRKNKTNPQLIYDKAWWSAAVIIFFCHMFDLQYFDVRIGFTLWILLGGLRNMLREKIPDL